MNTPPGIPSDPCSGGLTVLSAPFGKGKHTVSFGAPTAAIFCVRAENPGGIQTATISLDGDEVLGAAQFSNDQPVAQTYANLTPGNHEIEVHVKGHHSGSDLLVSVRASLDPTVPRPAGSGTSLSLANLFDHSDPITPNGDGNKDTALLGVDAVTGEFPGGVPSAEFQYTLDYTFTIRSNSSCDVVRVLSGSEPAKGGSQTVAVSWDGFDSLGDVVPDGEYVYSAEVNFIRTHNSTSTVLGTVTTHLQSVSVVADPLCVFSTDCDDGSPCTDDSCVAGACVNTSNDNPCGPANEPWAPDQLVVLFATDTSEAQRVAIIANAGATITTQLEHLRLYEIQFAEGTDLDAAAANLLLSGDVVVVIKNFVGENQMEPNDPLFPFGAGGDQWNLDLTAGGPAEPTALSDNGDMDMPESWDIENDVSGVIMAIVDDGVDFGHPDMVGRYWLNPLECGACTANATCPADEVTVVNGFPGAIGDDDADGLADFADPQVRALMSNHRDDDGDGCKDEGGGAGAFDDDGDGCKDEDPVDVPPFDDDGDGTADEDDIDGIDCFNPGGPVALTDETADCDGAAADDDENGYIDDCRGYDFTSRDNNPSNASATHHGVRVAGVAAATGNNGIGISGVTQNGKVMAVRSGTTVASTLEAYEYAANNGAHVINASHQFAAAPSTRPEITELYRAIHVRHSLLVVAAGNNATPEDLDALGTVRFPQHVDLPHVVLVTDTDSTGDRVASGNYGATLVDFAAPGDEITSTIATGATGTTCISSTTGPGYDCSSIGAGTGTSLSASHVTGTVALLIARFPELAYDTPRIAKTLRDNVQPVSGGTGSTVTNGRVNTCRSLQGCGGGGPPSPAYFVERTRGQLPSAFMDVPTYEVDLFDADADGDPDMFSIMCSQSGALTQPLLFLNSGSFSGVFVNAPNNLPAAPRNHCGAGQSDVNNDGFLDIISAGFGVVTPAETQDRLYMNCGGFAGGTAGVFKDVTAASSIDCGGGAVSICGGMTCMPTDTVVSRDVDFCDLDGDSDDDVVISGNDIRVYINQGPGVNAGRFSDLTSTWIPFAISVDSHNTSCVNLRGSTRPDLFITTGFGTQNLLLVNTGSAFADETSAAGIPTSTAYYTHDAEIADYDGDTFPDIVLGLRDNGQVRYLRNKGTGAPDPQFVEETGVTAACSGVTVSGRRIPALAETTTEVDTADFDGDGDRDLLILNGDPNSGVPLPHARQSRVYINVGSASGCFEDETFAAGLATGLPQANTEISTDSAIDDIDNDGDCDIVVGNWGAPHYLLEGTPDVAFPSGCMTVP